MFSLSLFLSLSPFLFLSLFLFFGCLSFFPSIVIPAFSFPSQNHHVTWHSVQVTVAIVNAWLIKSIINQWAGKTSLINQDNPCLLSVETRPAKETRSFDKDDSFTSLVLSVTVIALGNGLGPESSNPGQGHMHLCKMLTVNIPEKSTILSSAMNE